MDRSLLFYSGKKNSITHCFLYSMQEFTEDLAAWSQAIMNNLSILGVGILWEMAKTKLSPIFNFFWLSEYFPYQNQQNYCNIFSRNGIWSIMCSIFFWQAKVLTICQSRQRESLEGN